MYYIGYRNICCFLCPSMMSTTQNFGLFMLLKGKPTVVRSGIGGGGGRRVVVVWQLTKKSDKFITI